MLAFEVMVNGKRLCVMSTANHSVISTIVSWTVHKSDDIAFHVGGIPSDDSLAFTDWRTPALKTGDEILVRIVDVDVFDEPDDRTGFGPIQCEP
jgi:hypothetical protein